MKTTLILVALFLSASLTMAGDKASKSDPEAMFKSLDTNKDGFVSKEEYLASKKAQKDTEKAGKHFEKLDANKDGKLSKEEMAAGDKKGDALAPAKTEAKKPDEKKPEETKPAEKK